MKRAIIFCIIILISMSPLFRGLYFNFETYAFLAAIALLSIVYFFIKITRNEILHINKWFSILGIALILAYILSFIKSVNPRENLESILQLTEFVIVFIILFDFFYENKRKFLSVISLPLVLTGFFAAVVGLISLTGSFNILDVTILGNRIGTTFQYANTASIYFAICIIFTLTIANATENDLLRMLAAGMGNIIVFALFLTGSRGGYLIGFGAVLLFLLIQAPGIRIKGGIAFICMLVPVFAVLKYFNAGTAAHDNLRAVECLVVSFIISISLYSFYIIFTKLILKSKTVTLPKPVCYFVAFLFALILLILAVINRGRLFELLPQSIGARLARFNINDINVLYRIDLDVFALRLIKGNWLFGLGGGGWDALYQSVEDYFYTAAFVHNHYLQVFVESGILGFLSYLALVVSGLLNAAYSWFKAADRTLKTYSAGLLCALLALAVHSSFDFDLSFIFMALLLWMMFAVASVGFPADETAKPPLFMRQWEVSANKGYIGIAAVIVCAVLFSVNSLYFTGAYNQNEAIGQMVNKEYKSAMAYYEEANRFDPANTVYTFELAKLYNYFALKSQDPAVRKAWLEKARVAGESSVNGNRGYPAYMNTLVRTYLASDMPLQAAGMAEKLVSYQKYNAEVYELLAESYIAEAGYYEKSGDKAKAREILENCLKIQDDPYLHKSNITKPLKLKPDAPYKQSKTMTELMNKALNEYERIQ